MLGLRELKIEGEHGTELFDNPRTDKNDQTMG
jgi:hypothetical protein